MMEIGSIYSLRKLEVEAGPSFLPAGNDALYFSLCREALLVVARHYGFLQKKVLLPAYTCQTVIDPFLQEGWEIGYYHIKDNLRIDVSDLRAKYLSFQPSLCVAHPYYGADLNQEELETLSELKSAGCVLIEDLTQCVFSTQRNPIFDCFTGSYRKWFPIPDGAFLLGKDLVVDEMVENERFVRTMADAMYLRGNFHQTGDVNIKEISRRVGNEAIHLISGEIVPHKMSGFSFSLMSGINIKDVQQKRLANYQYLFEHLQDSMHCRPIDRQLEELTCAPLFFPIYVRDRAAFQKKLAQSEIYAPVLWPVYTDAVLINDDIKKIYDNILMLPIDQRYDSDDMQRMVEVINL